MARPRGSDHAHHLSAARRIRPPSVTPHTNLHTLCSSLIPGRALHSSNWEGRGRDGTTRFGARTAQPSETPLKTPSSSLSPFPAPLLLLRPPRLARIDYRCLSLKRRHFLPRPLSTLSRSCPGRTQPGLDRLTPRPNFMRDTRKPWQQPHIHITSPHTTRPAAHMHADRGSSTHSSPKPCHQ